jgi:hypothetical protein
MARAIANWHSDARAAVVARASPRSSPADITPSPSGNGHEPLASDVVERASDGKSVAERRPYILNALQVLRDHPLVGGGSASLLIPKVPWASAHVSYLSVLARYGLSGAMPYFIFMGYPILFVLVRRAGMLQNQISLIAGTLGALFVVYLSYDIFFYFEVQYLFFGIAYAIVLQQSSGMSSNQQRVAELV